MDNPFTTSSDPGDEKKVDPKEENVAVLTKADAEVEVEGDSPHAKQLRVVAEVTARLEAAAHGRVEAEVGLEEDYWKLRDELNRAHRRLEELL